MELQPVDMSHLHAIAPRDIILPPSSRGDSIHTSSSSRRSGVVNSTIESFSPRPPGGFTDFAGGRKNWAGREQDDKVGCEQWNVAKTAFLAHAAIRLTDYV